MTFKCNNRPVKTGFAKLGVVIAATLMLIPTIPAIPVKWLFTGSGFVKRRMYEPGTWWTYGSCIVVYGLLILLIA